MRSFLLFLATLAAIPAWSATPASSDDNVLYVHLMDNGEVVHTVVVRDGAFLVAPGQTRVVVLGTALKTAVVKGAAPYRIYAHLPAGLCASSHLVQLTSGATSIGELANLYALQACQDDLRVPRQVNAGLQR